MTPCSDMGGEDRATLVRMAEGSLRIAALMEDQARTQRAAAERLYARASLAVIGGGRKP